MNRNYGYDFTASETYNYGSGGSFSQCSRCFCEIDSVTKSMGRGMCGHCRDAERIEERLEERKR